MNLLVTGAWQGAKENIKLLEAMGHKVAFLQFEKDELPCHYDWVEGVICNGLFLRHSIEQFTCLKYIQLTSAGFDRVPMDYILAHGIEVHNARGVYSIPMAEFALGGVLQLYKQMTFFTENQKKRLWIKNRKLQELFGKTVCIVGCGSVGSECARRFQAFGCKVIGIATYERRQAYFDSVYSLECLDEMLDQADVVILTIPLTTETRYLINLEQFRKMKKNVVLVNLARGAVVHTEALKKALKDQMISGAVLDVFEEEPLSENDLLWNMDNVIITPHISFVGEGNSDRLNAVILKNIKGMNP